MPDTGPIFSLVPSYFVQNGDTLLPVQHNPVFEDIRDALTNRVTRDGAGNMTGDLDMAGNKVVGLAAATSPSDAVILAQIEDVAYLNIAQTWTAAQTFSGGIDAVGDTGGSRVRLQRTGAEVFYLAGLPGEFRIGNETDGISLVRFLPGDTRFADPISSPGGTASGQHRNNGQNDERFVQLSGNQTIAGDKTFTGILAVQGANPQIHINDTDGINWAIVSNNNTDLLIGVDRDNSGTIEAPHPLLLESDNNRGLLFGLPIASVYTGSSANETNFPIGTTLLVALASPGDDLPARNSVVTVRLNPGNTAQYIWGSSATGTVVSGTWRNRGSLVQGGALLMERVA